MSYLTNESLIFMVDLINCMLDDIDYTINSTNDNEYIRCLELSRSRLLSTHQILTQYIIRKGIK